MRDVNRRIALVDCHPSEFSCSNTADVDSFRKPISFHETCIFVCGGVYHPDVLASLGGQPAAGSGRRTLQQGHGALRAKKVCRSAAAGAGGVANDEKALGPNHLDFAKDLNLLGLLYHELRHYAEAEASYERSLAIREKQLWPDHPDVANRSV